MADHNFNLNNIHTVEEALKEMDYQQEKMYGLSSLAKRSRYYNMVAIYKKFPELKAWWGHLPDETQYLNKFIKKKQKKKQYYPVNGNLPKLELPCADASCLPEGRGLYFIGMIGINPNETKYYLVKIGSAENIAKRVRQYGTYNPMIYIGGAIENIDGRLSDAETTCHEYLADKAYAYAQNAREWFYVNEETYYELCDIFANKEMFKAIAEGRD